MHRTTSSHARPRRERILHGRRALALAATAATLLGTVTVGTLASADESDGADRPGTESSAPRTASGGSADPSTLPSGSPGEPSTAPSSPSSPSPSSPSPSSVPDGRPHSTGPAEVVRDVAYAPGSAAQHLDLHLPERTGRPVPLVVYVHGGAFRWGSRTEHEDKYRAMVARGWAVAAVDYRLSEEAAFPAGVQDVKAAVRWVRAHARDYGIDPNRFVAWGDSAGGYMATMLGVTGGRHTVFDDPSLGNARTSSAVQGVVDWYGPSDFLLMDTHAAAGPCEKPQVHDEAGSPESLWLGAPIQTVPDLARQSNPITYVRGARRLPSFYLTHGDHDCLVPSQQSDILAEALRARHAPVTYTTLAGAEHADARFMTEQLEPTLDFIASVFCAHPGHGRG